MMSLPPQQPLVKKGRGRPPGSKKKVLTGIDQPLYALPAAAPLSAPLYPQLKRKNTHANGAKVARSKGNNQNQTLNDPSNSQSQQVICDAQDEHGIRIQLCFKEIKAVAKSNSITRAYNSHVEMHNSRGFPMRATSITTIPGAEQLTSLHSAERHLIDDLAAPPLDEDHDDFHACINFAAAPFGINGQGSSSSSSSSSKATMTCEDLWKIIDTQAIMAPLSANSMHPLELLDMCGQGGEYEDLLTVPDVDPPQSDPPQSDPPHADPPQSTYHGGMSMDSFYYNRVLACLLSNNSSPKRKKDKANDCPIDAGGSNSYFSDTAFELTDGAGPVGLLSNIANSDLFVDLKSLQSPNPAALRASTCTELFKVGIIRPTDMKAHAAGAFSASHWMFNMEEEARSRRADDAVCVDLRRKMAELRRVNNENNLRVLKLKNVLMQRQYLEEDETLRRWAAEERAALERYSSYVKKTAESSRWREEEVVVRSSVYSGRSDHLGGHAAVAAVDSSDPAKKDKRPRVGL